jgi:phenylalanyl-tRNA synthetase beta chain
MRVSFKWLQEMVPFSVSAEQLAKDLTLLGLEVEGLEPWGDGDFVLEIQITPNRGDCVSVLGIARELSVKYTLPLKRPQLSPMPKGTAPKVTVKDYALCPRYTGIVLEVKKIEPSPLWLQLRLEASGLRPINNIVDITNYVLLETGQPLHAFDLDRLSGSEIIVRRAKKGEKIVLIDERELSLTKDDLVIADHDKPVAMAGVMGGMESEITPNTKRLLLESASFDSASVRRTSKRYGVVSDSSYRFERGVGYSSALEGSLRAIQLFTELGAGEVVGGYADLGEPPAERIVTIQRREVTEFLGMDVDWKEVIPKLQGLQLKAVDKADDELSITIPDFRPDIKDVYDIAEEIARLVGYDRIPATLPTGAFPAPQHAPLYVWESRLRKFLSACGLSEVVTLSFVNQRELDNCRFQIPEGESLIFAENPLSEEFTIMRPTLLPSMLNVLRHNIHRQLEDLALFEIANIYTRKGAELVEYPHLIIALTGKMEPAHWSSPHGRDAHFYDLSGILGLMQQEFNLSGSLVLHGEGGVYHRPKMGTGVHLDDKCLGFVGELHPEIAQNYDITKPVYIAELNILPLLEATQRVKDYQPISPYPRVERDLAILVDEGLPTGELLSLARREGGELLKKVWLFDLFSEEKVGRGKKSLGLRFVYQSAERTLTDEEVNSLHHQLVDKLVKAFNGQVR